MTVLDNTALLDVADRIRQRTAAAGADLQTLTVVENVGGYAAPDRTGVVRGAIERLTRALRGIDDILDVALAAPRSVETAGLDADTLAEAMAATWEGGPDRDTASDDWYLAWATAILAALSPAPRRTPMTDDERDPTPREVYDNVLVMLQREEADPHGDKAWARGARFMRDRADAVIAALAAPRSVETAASPAARVCTCGGDDERPRGHIASCPLWKPYPASPREPRPEGPDEPDEPCGACGYSRKDCWDQSNIADNGECCAECDHDPAAPRSVETAGLREWPDRAWLIAHWVGHRCEMVGCRATKPHEHGGGQPMREMTPEERVAALSPDTTETP